MVVLASNLAAMFTNRQLNINSNNKSKAEEKLSSGYRINRSADDAAGLKISEKMRSQIRGLERGKRNIMDGISFIQVADGAMSEMHDMVQRVRELAVQASNDTNTQDERDAMQQEISQIKKELNRIALNTEFNGEDVFDNSYTMMEVDGTPGDLTIFNSSYNAATGDVTYGGFVFHGNRITWDQVNPGMVQIDANGKQTFVGGNYTYIDAATGCSFNITCKDGDEVPTLKRDITISADVSGIYVDGKHYGWNELKDEDGKGLSSLNIGAGTWSLNYEGAEIAFFIGNDVKNLHDMADAINSCKDGKIQYSLHTKYVGPYEEKAVDVDKFVKNMQISNVFAQYITANNDVEVIVRAGDGQNGTKNGIWLEKSDGTEITGSFQSWDDMGISSWEQGTDINKDYVYQYSDTEGVNDTLLSFDFTLSEVTSLDSVIDGLDHMVISGKNITTHYETNVNVTQDKNIKKVQSKAYNNVYFTEEKEFGRDFDQKTVDDLSDANLVYDSVNEKITMDFLDAAGNSVISYEGDAVTTKANITNSVNNYLSYVIKRKTEAALAGQDPQKVEMRNRSLDEVVGAGNVTASGYFDQVFTLDKNSMKVTDGDGSYTSGNDGETYPGAFIDFGGLGTSFTLDDLIGTGFNSTCKTCNNHYSVMFVESLTGASTTADGYAYAARQQGPNDYILQVDINSLKASGVTSGADLANAFVDIASECYDFHYTQYAADGSTLRIYDDRESATVARDATFDTMPYLPISSDVFDLTVKSADGRYISASYTYDYADAADNVVVEMVNDNAGDYVQLPDGTYEKYDAAAYPDPANQPQRYSLNITYKKTDGSLAADKEEVAGDYAGEALKNITGKTNVQLDATDYTYINVSGDENPNVAINSEFEAYVDETEYENILHIQVSGRAWDSIEIPRITVNNLKTHIYKANVSTWQNAQNTIGYADYAINYISEQRALYGAYQNRLEHTYNNNANTEENVTAAESRLRDTDMADEMVNYTRHSILEQAGQSLLAQANKNPENVLQLLQ